MLISSSARRVAVLMLAACALGLTACSGTADAAPASSTPRASPTRTPAAAVVPFDGECSAMMTDDEATKLLGADAALATETLTSSTPDLNASLHLIGSISCLWTTDAGAYLQTAVFPKSETSPEVVAKTEGTGCDSGYPTCWASRAVRKAWIYAESSTADAATGSLALVTDRMAGQPDPTPGARESSWWILPTCDELAATVSAAAGVEGLESGFPGDSIPSGAVWDTADAAGIVRWCSWYSQSAAESAVVQVNLQPGAGRPTSALLVAAGATPLTVARSETAWSLAVDSGTTRLLAMSGDNRLTVTDAGGAAQHNAAVASAVITQLNAG